MLVSATFVILGYIVFTFPPDSSENSIRMRGLSYLALLPYFFGALINREGYWPWTKGLDHSQRGRKWKVLLVIVALLLVGTALVAYLNLGSNVVTVLLLLILAAVWLAVVRHAWTVYEQSQVRETNPKSG